MCFKNWRCNLYRVDLVKGDFSYQELKEYFALNGSDKVECIKNWGLYAAGTIYRVKETNYGFLIY